MAKKTATLLPTTDDLLRQFGERLRLARQRRRLSAKQVSERSGMAPMTLRSLERGGSGVTMGAYLSVMQVLGIEKDLELLAKADPVGRELQDAQLPSRSKATAPALPTPVKWPTTAKPRPKPKPKPGLTKDAPDWIEKSGFASSEALAGLIVPMARPKKKAR